MVFGVIGAVKRAPAISNSTTRWVDMPMKSIFVFVGSIALGPASRTFIELRVLTAYDPRLNKLITADKWQDNIENEIAEEVGAYIG
jgi:hypothetical protein